nr:hypothetical protein L204_05180 [Cryptococcus depauperatus CBS 7855]
MRVTDELGKKYWKEWWAQPRRFKLWEQQDGDICLVSVDDVTQGWLWKRNLSIIQPYPSMFPLLIPRGSRVWRCGGLALTDGNLRQRQRSLGPILEDIWRPS